MPASHLSRSSLPNAPPTKPGQTQAPRETDADPHSTTKVVILGAAGRDFHNFNTSFRDNAAYEVVCFTAAQIPGIGGRVYPPSLAGSLYPNGIPIREEKDLKSIIAQNNVDVVVFGYSDVSHAHVMERGAAVLASGCDFWIMGPNTTQIPAKPSKANGGRGPVIVSVVASRTGSGKSQVSRAIVRSLKNKGVRVVGIRHPMPYGNLKQQAVQRFATARDLVKHECTIEEREEYEPYVDWGLVVYAGVDYGAILDQASQEADVILWDGGNNDMCFYRPDIEICVLDPLRPGHETAYYPGSTNVRRANVILINKIDSSGLDDQLKVRSYVREVNPDAVVCEGASPITVGSDSNAMMIQGKRVLCIEDGPTLTHGQMKFGAATVAAKRLGAAALVDPRPFAVGTIKETFEIYPNTGVLLPAMGYSAQQIADLEATINACDADVVLAGTPIDLTRIISVNKPLIRATYDLQCVGEPNLIDLVHEKLRTMGVAIQQTDLKSKL